MTYKNKFIYLVSLIAVLSLAYLGSFIFSAEKSGARYASYVWLDSKLASRTSRIEISAQGQFTELVKKNNKWFVLHNEEEYPARQRRIEDFLGIFTKRGTWTVRTSNASAHERLGLDDNASRITIHGENTVLLDILIGGSDITGREINIRKAGVNEVRTGDDKITPYITGPATNWFNLALIAESADGKLDAQSVQRISIYTETGTGVFTRRNRGWTVTGLEIANPDNSAIENYISIILNTEGDNFAEFIPEDDPIFTNRIVLEFGNGSISTIRLNDGDETGRRLARVSGSDYTYSIPSWAASRLFRDAASFERK